VGSDTPQEGSYQEVSDRTARALYKLLPYASINAIILLALHAALRLHPDVGVLGVIVMGNHWHLLLRAGADPNGIPGFMQAFKSVVAKEVNELLGDGDEGPFWARRYTPIQVLDHESLLARLVYFVMNPVRAGLCARFEEWPGVSTTLQLLGFAPKFDIQIELPREWQGLTEEQLAEKRAHLLTIVRAEEAAVAEDRRRRGLPRPNVERMLKRLTHEDRPSRPKRGRRPLCFAATLAAKDAFRRARKWLRSAYDAASELFRAGMLDVMFPARTFPPRLMRPPVEAPA
jgi:hypothetical protein